MSKKDEIKNKRRKQGIITPTSALTQEVWKNGTKEDDREGLQEENNKTTSEVEKESTNEENNLPTNVLNNPTTHEETLQSAEEHVNLTLLEMLAVSKKFNEETTNQEKKEEINESIKQKLNQTMTEGMFEMMKQENNVSAKESRKRVSFDLDKNLHKQVKMASFIEDRQIYLIIEEAIRDYLEKHHK